MKTALTDSAFQLMDEAGIVVMSDERLEFIAGPWSRLCDQMGWKDALALAARDEESFMAALADEHDALHQAILLRAQSEHGSGCCTRRVLVADDWAGAPGLLLPPHLVARLIREIYPALIAGLNHLGFHTDCLPAEYASQLADVGFDFIHTSVLRPSSWPVLARACASSTLRLYGGLSSAQLSAGTPARAYLQDLLAWGTSYGMVACDDGGLTTAAQLDHLEEAFAILS